MVLSDGVSEAEDIWLIDLFPRSVERAWVELGILGFWVFICMVKTYVRKSSIISNFQSQGCLSSSDLNRLWLCNARTLAS